MSSYRILKKSRLHLNRMFSFSRISALKHLPVYVLPSAWNVRYLIFKICNWNEVNEKESVKKRSTGWDGSSLFDMYIYINCVVECATCWIAIIVKFHSKVFKISWYFVCNTKYFSVISFDSKYGSFNWMSNTKLQSCLSDILCLEKVSVWFNLLSIFAIRSHQFATELSIPFSFRVWFSS